MTFQEFLNSPVALKYREDNLQSMIDSLQTISEDGEYPIANNLAVLTALANENIDQYLENYYYSVVYPSVIKERVLILLTDHNEAKKPNLQNIMKQIIKECNTTGIGVYKEIRDMINKGLLKINNKELNNESIVEIVS